jgi:mRNA-degrading endonuclease RelE of RelBE toxin-antitoxin system
MNVTFTRRAVKEFNRLPSNYKKRVLKKLRIFESEPKSPALDIKPFFGLRSDSYRLRVGKVRLVFYIEEDRATVYAVGFRGDVYK